MRIVLATLAAISFVTAPIAGFAQGLPAARGQAVDACKAELGKTARGASLAACVTRRMDTYRTAHSIEKNGKACPVSSLGPTC